MKKKNGSIMRLLYGTVMPKLYGIGAAVVVVGVMFKLLNWEGGRTMLGVGLSLEALIFFLGAFEPKEEELDWKRVYPELGDEEGAISKKISRRVGSVNSPAQEEMEKVIHETSEETAELKSEVSRLKDKVRALGDVCDNLLKVVKK